MVVPPLPTIQHIPMLNSLPLSSSCRWPNSFVAMSHGHPNFEHPSHLFKAITHHNGWTVGRNTTVLHYNQWPLPSLHDAPPDHNMYWRLLEGWYQAVLIKFFIRIPCHVDSTLIVTKVNIALIGPNDFAPIISVVRLIFLCPLHMILFMSDMKVGNLAHYSLVVLQLLVLFDSTSDQSGSESMDIKPWHQWWTKVTSTQGGVGIRMPDRRLVGRSSLQAWKKKKDFT